MKLNMEESNSEISDESIYNKKYFKLDNRIRILQVNNILKNNFLCEVH